MGTADSIRRVADILKDTLGDKVAVVSATSGTTDLLIKLGQEALNNERYMDTFQQLVDKHEAIITELNCGSDLSSYYQDIEKLLNGINMLQELSATASDRLLSFGERISSVILADYLNSQGIKASAVDAYELVYTDNKFGEGNVIFTKTYETTNRKLSQMLENGVLPVVTGFIGQAANGHYITLGRGGSDYTGAIVAGAMEAAELQIWTDVDGVLNTDPRLVPEAEVLPQLSYAEAGELAYFGAKVLHPKTIKPAVQKNIPVKILNTFHVEAKGTVITHEEIDSLKSVTYKKGITVVNITSAELLESFGYLAKIFEVFAKFNVVVDVVSTSEVSVSLTVDKVLPKNLVSELEEFSQVEISENMAIVCLVGNGIKSNTKVLGELFSNISEFDVSMVSQGASKRNITFLVREDKAPQVVNRVFSTFFYN